MHRLSLSSSWPYVTTLGIIVLALLGVSLWRLSKTRTRADYLIAGRSLTAFVLVFTLLSSWIGSGSLLAGAENAYRNGFAALWQAAGGWAGLLLVYFIAPRARKFAGYTIPDLLEARYNQAARILGVIAILFAYTGIASYQFIGGGDILHLLFPSTVSAGLGKVLIAFFVILFTAIAGMSSIAYMDLVIGIAATIALTLALPFTVSQAGGWSRIYRALPASHFEIFGSISPMGAMELFLPTLLLLLGNQSMYQKFFSARSEKDARRSVVGWIVGTAILETIIVAIAVAGSALFPGGEIHRRPREIIAYTALYGMPRWLGALAIGAVFAKIISTANNYLFSPAANLVNDLFLRYLAPHASNRTVLLMSRLLLVLVGLWSLYQAFGTQSVLAKALYAYTVYSAALTPVILAAFYSRRANSYGAVSAIAAGTLATVLWDSHWLRERLPAVLAERDAIFPALLIAVACLVLVSAWTPPPAARQLAPFSEPDDMPMAARAGIPREPGDPMPDHPLSDD